LFDAHDLDLFLKLVSVNPISISQEIFRCAVERKGFNDLLRRPFCSRMCGDIEMHDTPSIMHEHYKLW